MKRRSFLGALIAAPSALPVAAKEAAAKMGMTQFMVGSQSLVGPVNEFSKYPSNVYPSSQDANVSPQDNINYYKNLIRDITSGDRREEIINNCKSSVRVLDSDLAALKSISPATAYNIQMQRNIDKEIKKETSYYEKMIKKMTPSLLKNQYDKIIKEIKS